MMNTDHDGIQDGTEIGRMLADVFQMKWNTDVNRLIYGTDLSKFQPDLDPMTTTDPLNVDSDSDGLWDGFKDLDGDH